MQEAAEPLLQVIVRGDPHPLTLYADDGDLVPLVLWIVQNRAMFGIGKSYQVTIDVGEKDISGDVRLKARRLKRAS